MKFRSTHPPPQEFRIENEYTYHLLGDQDIDPKDHNANSHHHDDPDFQSCKKFDSHSINESMKPRPFQDKTHRNQSFREKDRPHTYQYTSLSLNQSGLLEPGCSAARALNENSEYQSCIDESISYLTMKSGRVNLNKIAKYPLKRKDSNHSFHLPDLTNEEEVFGSVSRIREIEVEDDSYNFSPSKRISKRMAQHLDLDPQIFIEKAIKFRPLAMNDDFRMDGAYKDGGFPLDD